MALDIQALLAEGMGALVKRVAYQNTELTAANERIRVLEEALRPWATLHDKLTRRSKQHRLDTYHDDCSLQDIMSDDFDRGVLHNKSTDPKVSDLRRAAAALAEKP